MAYPYHSLQELTDLAFPPQGQMATPASGLKLDVWAAGRCGQCP